VSVGSLYQYFPGKEALVAALVERHQATMWGLFEEKLEHLRTASLEEAARELVRIEIAAHAVDPKLHRVLIEQVPRIGRLEQVNESIRRVEDLIRLNLEARREQIRPENIPLAAFLLVQLVHSITRAAVLDRPDLLKEETLINETTEIVLRYLRKE
jgi:AcrR family transcriptional regulator